MRSFSKNLFEWPDIVASEVLADELRPAVVGQLLVEVLAADLQQGEVLLHALVQQGRPQLLLAHLAEVQHVAVGLAALESKNVQKPIPKHRPILSRRNTWSLLICHFNLKIFQIDDDTEYFTSSCKKRVDRKEKHQ